jgi:hypothetical protein
MEINVAGLDDPPMVANPISDIEVDEDADDTVIDLSNVFTDPDNDDSGINKKILDKGDSLLISAGIIGNKLTIFYKPNQYGTTYISILASSNNKQVKDTFNVLINPVNDLPAGQDGEITLEEDRSYTFQPDDFAFNDVEDDSIFGIQLITNVTSGKLIYNGGDINLNKVYENIDELVFAPVKNESGLPYTFFQYKVIDSAKENSESAYSMKINVVEINDPPVFLLSLPDTAIPEGQILTWQYRAHDPENNTLQYYLRELATLSNIDKKWNTVDETGISIDSTTGKLLWTTDYELSGGYRIIVEVTDGRASIRDTAFIRINNINRKPEFTNILQDTTINNNLILEYTYQAFDPDHDQLIFGSKDTIKNMVINSSGSLTWQIPEEPEEQYRISVFVTDSLDTVITSSIVKVNDVVAIDKTSEIPVEYILSCNYPNPFNPVTIIEYALPEETKVKISIFDINGNLIEKLIDRAQSPGYYKITWNASTHTSGVYLYRIMAGQFIDVKKCILIK